MTNLTQASRQLFRRPPDERFASLQELLEHALSFKNRSKNVQESSARFHIQHRAGAIALQLNGAAPCTLNDWSFAQLCSLVSASKDTVNRLRADTAVRVCRELLEQRNAEALSLQALVLDDRHIRAVNGATYTRLWNADLLAMLVEFATDFTPPPKGFNGATGLYAGEQDMFCFMIDPTCWVEIQGEAFAPGFFVWNSEVGRRTVGIATFWFQQVCQNHIVWDAIEFKEFTRKHTGQVHDSMKTIRGIIEALVKKRDERKDRFAAVIKKAMETKYANDGEETLKLLTTTGFSRLLAKKALELAREKGRFTIWAVVDALTQLAREHKHAGTRADADHRAARLLEMAAA